MKRYFVMEKEILSFIDLKTVLNPEVPVYAHTRDDGTMELLEEHVERCRKHFCRIYEEKEIDNILRRYCRQMKFHNLPAARKQMRNLFIHMVVFHDFGKINPEFQEIKMKNTMFHGTYEGISGTEHSLLSAIIYLDYFWAEAECDQELEKEDRRLLKKVVFEMSFVIARHHSNFCSLQDYAERLCSGEVQCLLENLSRNPLYGYVGLRCLTWKKVTAFRKSYGKIQKADYGRDAGTFFLCRLAYSLLVCCDYYAAADFISGVHKMYYGSERQMDRFRQRYCESELMKSIRAYERDRYEVPQSEFTGNETMNELRSRIFLDAERTLAKYPDESIYFMEAPTGSGKSNMAVNLSFHIMEQAGKLFYIYPFNTLVEQNRNNLEDLFPDRQLQQDIVVVNSITPVRGMENQDEDSTDYYEKALLDRQFLNYPFILTTHVSFFNLLFGTRKEDLFGFVQLSGAVAVLDEIQSYRNSIWKEMIIFLKACAELMGMKVIIMSATLPNLELFCDNSAGIRYLLEDSRKYFSHPVFKNRVRISWELLREKMTLEKLKAHVLETCRTEKKVLVEFIKKSTAMAFYQMMCETEDDREWVKCITGDDSMWEREQILKPIRENQTDKVLLIATQVIEAGVDIDMDVGYKDISRLDSEEQFMGRINRSCKKDGLVYFFDLDQANHIYRDDYRMDDSLTLKSESMQKLLQEKTFPEYYHKVMEIMKNNRYESTGKEGIDSFFTEEVKQLDYPAVEKRMQLIEEDRWSMDIVLCREIELADGTLLNGKEVWDEYKDLLKNLSMPYAEKQIRLSEVRSRLSYFIYQIKKNYNLIYTDQIGELYCIENGEQYFVNGKLDREKLEEDGMLFLDL